MMIKRPIATALAVATLGLFAITGLALARESEPGDDRGGAATGQVHHRGGAGEVVHHHRQRGRPA